MSWNDVPCAWALLVLYVKSVLSFSLCSAINIVDVIVSLNPEPPAAFPWNPNSTLSFAGWIFINLNKYVLYVLSKTTTAFGAYHNEADSDTSLSYNTGADLSQSTSDQILSVHGHVGGGADESCSGEMFLFNPSSTTFVKHFTAVNQHYYNGTYSIVAYVAGYCNTTTAIDGVTFKFTSGNIDSGRIALYGIK